MNWKSPENAKQIKMKYVMVSGKFYHKMYPDGEEVIGSDHSEIIDDKEWELATVTKESEDFYWGMFVEGLGMIDCMFPKEQVRELTDNEKAYFSKATYGMYGSNTDRLSYQFKLGEIK